MTFNGERSRDFRKMRIGLLRIMNKSELAEFALRKLEIRFGKIEPEEYYLSYSGGLDSHLLYWYIKERLEDTQIKIVSINTYREHPEIRERMYKNSDEVLYPAMSMKDIKAKYGIPCFTKFQDEIIGRYQRGSRAPYTMNMINGVGTTMFGLNKRARTLLLSGELHRVDNKCCKYTKKKPLHQFERRTGLKPIVAVRGSEGIMRKSRYRTCLDVKGKFTPLFDFTNQMIEAIYECYEIPKPEIYKIVDRTGCTGCPYGWHGRKQTLEELKATTPGQRKYAIDSFRESYDVLGIDYKSLEG